MTYKPESKIGIRYNLSFFIAFLLIILLVACDRDTAQQPDDPQIEGTETVIPTPKVEETTVPEVKNEDNKTAVQSKITIQSPFRNTLTPFVSLTPSHISDQKVIDDSFLCPSPTGEQPYLFPGTPWGDYTTQILDYLTAIGAPIGLQSNLNQLDINDGLNAWKAKAGVRIADVTGDTKPEIVIDLFFFQTLSGGDLAQDMIPVYGRIYIFWCRNKEFVGGSIEEITGGTLFEIDQLTGVRQIRDMNRNRIPEIIFSFLQPTSGQYIYGPADDSVRGFRIIEWNGDEFDDLIQNGLETNIAEVVNGDGATRDINGDGFVELILSEGRTHGLDEFHPLYRTSADIWSWNGTFYTYKCKEVSSPVYRYHAIEDGDDATLCGNYSKALISYLRAIYDQRLLDWKEIIFYDPPDRIELARYPDPDERIRLHAYARYRILLLYSLQNHISSAEIAYDSMQDKFPRGSAGYPYARLAKIFWELYKAREDFSAACDVVIKYARSNEEAVLSPLSGDYYSYYPTRNIQPEDICPVYILGD